MAIAKDPFIVLDCPDPAALAGFYARVLDWRVETEDDGSWAIATDGSRELNFQRAEDYRPPRWPSAEMPQQMHLDLMVEDLDAGEAAVLDLGATTHEHQPGESFRVFLDPAGHPFCLCRVGG